MKKPAIHHATAARAKKLGIVLEQVDHDLFSATKDGAQLAEGTDPKAVLAKAEATLPKPEKPVKTPKAPKAKKAKGKKRRKASEDGEDEDGDEEGGEPKSVIAAKYKKRYQPNKDTCGDRLVAPVFEYTHPDGEDLDPKLLVKLGKDNGVDVMDRWGHIQRRGGGWNTGMARMNLVNVLRGKLRRGEDVVIGSKTIKGDKVEKAAK